MIKENQKLLNLFHVVLDALIIAFSFFAAYELRFDRDSFLVRYHVIKPPMGYYFSRSQYMEILLFIIPCYILIYYFCDLYDPKRTGRRSELYCLLKANAFGMIYTTAMLYFINQTNFARLFLGLFVILNVTIDYAIRLIIFAFLKKMRREGRNQKHVLLVGYSRSAIEYIDRLRSHPEWGYYVHGILDDNESDKTIYRNVPVFGTIDELPGILATNKYDEVAITLSISEFSKLENIIDICEKAGVYTKFVPDYHQIFPAKPYTEDLDGIPVIHLRHVPLSSSLNNLIKRIFDLTASGLGLIILAIPMLIIAAIIKSTSKGPVIFSQVRVGLHNREFKMYKFRSMYQQDPKAEVKKWTTKDDPRVTPIGRFMRRTNIDELPQLFNVFIGNMSLVGPRPERPYFVKQFQQTIPRYMIKHQVRPGMTGWAQVNGYRGDTSIEKRIQYDLYYVENWTFRLDIKILFLTFFGKKVNENAY
ncbi:MAG: undecaprenyl-phosphate glucose phosphotransferase [Lachnospiraceae bacterium]|jgi:Undecaprenyl-phosphate glucose phosphotransferase|nr:undecaprenyl-phosphate glucose phosphotransferase [Lachnospiraceae bacterium]MEE3460683.1 undecaprenyl-phosphate glucose phosphotransferase [Lachnospiraceae bacterium]